MCEGINYSVNKGCCESCVQKERRIKLERFHKLISPSNVIATLIDRFSLLENNGQSISIIR